MSSVHPSPLTNEISGEEENALLSQVHHFEASHKNLVSLDCVDIMLKELGDFEEGDSFFTQKSHLATLLSEFQKNIKDEASARRKATKNLSNKRDEICLIFNADGDQANFMDQAQKSLLASEKKINELESSVTTRRSTEKQRELKEYAHSFLGPAGVIPDLENVDPSFYNCLFYIKGMPLLISKSSRDPTIVTQLKDIVSQGYHEDTRLKVEVSFNKFLFNMYSIESTALLLNQYFHLIGLKPSNLVSFIDLKAFQDLQPKEMLLFPYDGIPPQKEIREVHDKIQSSKDRKEPNAEIVFELLNSVDNKWVAQFKTIRDFFICVLRRILLLFHEKAQVESVLKKSSHDPETCLNFREIFGWIERFWNSFSNLGPAFRSFIEVVEAITPGGENSLPPSTIEYLLYVSNVVIYSRERLPGISFDQALTALDQAGISSQESALSSSSSLEHLNLLFWSVFGLFGTIEKTIVSSKLTEIMAFSSRSRVGADGKESIQQLHLRVFPSIGGGEGLALPEFDITFSHLGVAFKEQLLKDMSEPEFQKYYSQLKSTEHQLFFSKAQNNEKLKERLPTKVWLFVSSVQKTLAKLSDDYKKFEVKLTKLIKSMMVLHEKMRSSEMTFQISGVFSNEDKKTIREIRKMAEQMVKSVSISVEKSILINEYHALSPLASFNPALQLSLDNVFSLTWKRFQTKVSNDEPFSRALDQNLNAVVFGEVLDLSMRVKKWVCGYISDVLEILKPFEESMRKISDELKSKRASEELLKDEFAVSEKTRSKKVGSHVVVKNVLPDSKGRKVRADSNGDTFPATNFGKLQSNTLNRDISAPSYNDQIFVPEKQDPILHNEKVDAEKNSPEVNSIPSPNEKIESIPYGSTSSGINFLSAPPRPDKSYIKDELFPSLENISPVRKFYHDRRQKLFQIQRTYFPLKFTQISPQSIGKIDIPAAMKNFRSFVSGNANFRDCVAMISSFSQFCVILENELTLLPKRMVALSFALKGLHNADPENLHGLFSSFDESSTNVRPFISDAIQEAQISVQNAASSLLSIRVSDIPAKFPTDAVDSLKAWILGIPNLNMDFRFNDNEVSMLEELFGKKRDVTLFQDKKAIISLQKSLIRASLEYFDQIKTISIYVGTEELSLQIPSPEQRYSKSVFWKHLFVDYPSQFDLLYNFQHVMVGTQPIQVLHVSANELNQLRQSFRGADFSEIHNSHRKFHWDPAIGVAPEAMVSYYFQAAFEYPSEFFRVVKQILPSSTKSVERAIEDTVTGVLPGPVSEKVGYIRKKVSYPECKKLFLNKNDFESLTETLFTKPTIQLFELLSRGGDVRNDLITYMIEYGEKAIFEAVKEVVYDSLRKLRLLMFCEKNLNSIG